MKITIKTLFGLEEVVGKELEEIGITEYTIGRRAVFITGDHETLYKVNYLLRSAIRVLVELKQFKVHSFQDIYNAVQSIQWNEYLSLYQTFSIDSAVKSQFFTHSQYVALKCKDAIVDQFRNKTGKRPNVDISRPDIRLNVHIYERDMTLSLDSSGDSLHKRGYKTMSVAAPLSEVLGAGILKLSGWDKQTKLYDPMCGSGTFPIEAYMLSRNIAAQKFRRHFCFQNWNDFDKNKWEIIKDQAEDQEIDSEVPIEGSDMMEEAVNAAERNARPLRRTRKLKFKTEDLFDKEMDEGSFVVINPPYNTRLELKNVIEHYSDIGDHMKHHMKGCKVWILSGSLEGIKHVGLKPFKKIDIMNGPIKGRLNGFDIY